MHIPCWGSSPKLVGSSWSRVVPMEPLECLLLLLLSLHPGIQCVPPLVLLLLPLGSGLHKRVKSILYFTCLYLQLPKACVESLQLLVSSWLDWWWLVPCIRISFGPCITSHLWWRLVPPGS